METNIIHAHVKGRAITLDKYVRPTAGNVNHDLLKISMDDEWKGLSYRVTFSGSGAEVTMAWDGTTDITIPWEVLREPGTVELTVVATEDGIDRLVSKLMEGFSAIYVNRAGNDEGVSPSGPSEDLLHRVERIASELEGSEADRQRDFEATQEQRSEAFASASNARMSQFSASMASWGHQVDLKAAEASAAAQDARTATAYANASAANANDAASEIKARADRGEFDGKTPVKGVDYFDGKDGHSPVVTASKSGKVTTVKVDGNAIATINDGENGRPGAPGKDAPPYDDSAIQARMSALEEQLSKQDTSNLWGVSFAGSSNTQGVQRLYAAASLGMLSYATEADAGKYPFDAAEPWRFNYWLVRYDADGYPVKVASMTMDGVKSPGWDENAATLDRFVEFPNAWFMRDDSAGIYLVSSVEREGFTRFYAKPDGTEPEMLPLIPCYKMGNATGAYNASSGTGCSRPGMNPHWGTFAQHRTLQQTASKRGHGGTTWFENWKQVMCYVELASRDVQGVLDFNGWALPGFSGGCYTNSASYNAIAAAAADTNTVQLVNATSYFAVGQTANVCQGWITSDKVTTRRITAISGNSVTLDGAPFSVEAGWFLYNMDWATGHCDSLKGHTGATTLSSNRHGMRWRGIEDLWAGSAEDIVDLRMTCAGAAEADGYDVWYCNDALKAHMAADAPSADYVLTGMNVPRADGYVKLAQAYGGDARLVMPLVATGGSATTYMADYCWTSSGYADNRSVRSGNYWYSGSRLGVFSRACNYAASYGNRYYCARLFLEP